MTDDQVAHGALVSLHCRGHFSLLDCDLFDLAIRASHIQNLARLVELGAVGNRVASVYVHDFLNHPDVPDLDHAIRICRGNILASDRELGVVDGVQVAVESLYCQTCAHVPNRDTLIGCPAHEEIGEGLEVEAVDGVSVLAVLLPHLEGVQIEQLDGALTTCREYEVASVVELHLPDRLGVAIGEGMCDRGAHEVPEFDAAVPA